MFGINPMEFLLVGCVALLLFGDRLPTVARSVGKSLTEFKKGVQGIQDDFNEAACTSGRSRVDYDDREEPIAPYAEPNERNPLHNEAHLS